MSGSRPDAGGGAPALAVPLVHVNDEAVAWREGLDLAALVAARGVDPRAVATALNGRFVPRGERAGTPVAPGDQVVLLQPIVGG